VITGHKDYAAEGKRLAEVLKQEMSSGGKLLDLGCGTGLHAIELKKHGFAVTGLDLSESMIASAAEKSQDITFIAGNICERHDLGPFDGCVCLFNVINCLESTADLDDFLKAVARVLLPGSPFVCECWNPIAILQEPPTKVVRTYSGNGFDITRSVTPESDFMALKLKLHYDITLQEQKRPATAEQFLVTHHLRLFTPTEVRDSLDRAGFSRISIHTALSEFQQAGDTDRQLAFLAFAPESSN